MPLPLLLLTRPEAQARDFAAALGVGPWEVLVAPLTEVVALDWDRRLAEGVRGVILTSANAVPAVAGLAPLPAWCVGGATARAASAEQSHR
jgi:uroporphyrinogen-III synthase